VVVGIDDTARPGIEAQIEIFGDGRRLFSRAVAKGQAVTLDLDVTGVLELKLAASATQEESLAGYTALGRAELQE
jgi:hypothetical protein